MGVVPHILWAFVVAIVLVPTLAATVSIQHAGARQAGIAFAVVACVQILLGFSLFIMQAVDADPTVLIVVTAVHTATGAFTLATVVVMAILIRRIIPAEPLT
jgi:heme A synthase